MRGTEKVFQLLHTLNLILIIFLRLITLNPNLRLYTWEQKARLERDTRVRDHIKGDSLLIGDRGQYLEVCNMVAKLLNS